MTQDLAQELTVAAQHHGQRIDAVLAQLMADYSRSQLTNWLKEGLILVNGQIIKPKDKARVGDRIIVNVDFSKPRHEMAVQEAQEIPLTIVYEDAHLLVINKPAGLVVHPGAGNPDSTLVNALLYHDATLSQLPRAGIVHRLDKDTTGLLLVAKTSQAYTFLTEQMQERLIDRHYMTLVYGHLLSGDEISTGYGRHSQNRLKMAVRPQGRQAITHYSVIERFPGMTLLHVKLMTGRTHQIRVHMAHINHAVIGDPLYGNRLRVPSGVSDDAKTKLQQFRRQALHAYQLSFTHPQTQERISCNAPMPDDFLSLLHALDEDFELPSC